MYRDFNVFVHIDATQARVRYYSYFTWNRWIIWINFLEVHFNYTLDALLLTINDVWHDFVIIDITVQNSLTSFSASFLFLIMCFNVSDFCTGISICVNETAGMSRLCRFEHLTQSFMIAFLIVKGSSQIIFVFCRIWSFGPRAKNGITDLFLEQVSVTINSVSAEICINWKMAN